MANKHKPEVKEKVALLLQVGESVTSVAKQMGISRKTVTRWKKDFNTQTVFDATVIKLVPNERLFLGQVGDRLVRVIKKIEVKPRPRSVVKVRFVEEDLYQME